MKSTFKRTTIACFFGIFGQAIITNIAAILFVPMMTLYGFDYGQLGVIVAVNFISQVSADILFSGAIDKLGYRKIVLPSCIMAAAGLILFALSPYIFPSNIYLGILISTIIFAFSSGLLEILLSPIVAAIPGNDKGPAMSLMHSFYAWGQAATIIITTIFIFLAGSDKWQIIVFAWAVIPLIAFYLFLFAPFPDAVPEEERQGFKKLIFHPFYIFALFAIFFGAGAEVVMNQWASTFMENGLHLPKLAGDLFGMCGFAVFLGIGRTLYGIFGSKINMSSVTIGGSLLAAVCYIGTALSPNIYMSVIFCVVCGIAVSLLWPGTIVLASDKFPTAGGWLFAILAAAGDIGASVFPWITGEVIDSSIESSFISGFADMLSISAEQASIRFGLLIAALFPIGALISHIILKQMAKSKKE